MDSSKYKTLKQVGKNTVKKHLHTDKKPVSVKWNVNCPNQIELEGGLITVGTCLRCKNSPCIKFREEEIKLSKLSQFPIDSSCNLCPTGGIEWSYENEAPIINEELCIGCGLCASRCPACAIYFKDNGTFAINDETDDYFVLNKTATDDEKTNHTLALLRNIPWSNSLIQETNKIFIVLYRKTFLLTGDKPNLLTRNILIQLGLKTGIRRTGDTHIRMDIVFEDLANDITGVGEVEFGMDVLSTPRNTLDNLAVFISRYEISKILPTIFHLSLPNQRSEYWKVIKDIKVVLGMPIRTITLGTLLLFLWNNIKLSMNTISNLYSDDDNFSGRQTIESALGKKINITEGFLGIIEPQK